MAAPVFIGDEVTASAYRLAGARVQTPEMRDVWSVFRRATGETDLVIVAANFAAALPEELLRTAIRKAEPLVLVVPDGSNRHVPEDLDTRVDRELEIER